MKNEMKLSGRAVGDRSRKPQRKVQHPGKDEEASTPLERYTKFQTMLSYQDTGQTEQDSETSALPGLGGRPKVWKGD